MRAALRSRTWWCCWMRSSKWPSTVHLPGEPSMSWAESKAQWPVGERRGFCPSALVTSHPEWCIQPWSLHVRRTWTCWRVQRRVTKMVGGMELLSCDHRESWGGSVWRTEGSRKIFTSAFQYLKGVGNRAGEGVFTRAYSDRRRNHT